MRKNVILQFQNMKTDECYDIEVPIHITANELLHSLNRGFHLGIDVRDISQCYLISENPIALLKGDVPLEEYGIRDGTKICFNR